jgi:hypothetical protein
MNSFRQVSKKLGGLRQFGGFQSSLVNIWGDPSSKMAGLEKVLLGMGKCHVFVLCLKCTAL